MMATTTTQNGWCNELKRVFFSLSLSSLNIHISRFLSCSVPRNYICKTRQESRDDDYEYDDDGWDDEKKRYCQGPGPSLVRERMRDGQERKEIEREQQVVRFWIRSQFG